MQKLIFEHAWDKTIAPADRDRIIYLFDQTKNETDEGIVLHSISQAINHRNDLLAIVLVHNYSNDVFSFESVNAAYFENNRKLAAEHFSFSNLSLDPKTSMPWTFIFPEVSHSDTPSLTGGYVKIYNESRKDSR